MGRVNARCDCMILHPKRSCICVLCVPCVVSCVVCVVCALENETRPMKCVGLWVRRAVAALREPRPSLVPVCSDVSSE